MAQVTIYLDEETAQAMRSLVKARNTSQSRWIRQLIEEALRDEWPRDVAELAGAWADFPSLAEIRKQSGEDADRVSF